MNKQAARRAVRRKARQSLRGWCWSDVDEWNLVSYAGEDYYGDDPVLDWLEPSRSRVTWRMATDPFRLVPAWVRSGAEATYELERAAWALTGERLCWTWGIPQSLCDEFHYFLRVFVWLDKGPFSIRLQACDHRD